MKTEELISYATLQERCNELLDSLRFVLERANDLEHARQIAAVTLDGDRIIWGDEWRDEARDAARYRWLRQEGPKQEEAFLHFAGDDLDAAIDDELPNAALLPEGNKP
jgi:hypothetical protein